MSSTDNEGRVHIDDEEVRGATSTGYMRYVLGIGLLLAIAAMSLIWITGAATQGNVEEAATMTGETEAVSDPDAEEDTDGVRGLDE